MTRDSPAIPDVLRRIVAARRQRYGLASAPAGPHRSSEPLGAASQPFLKALERARPRAVVAEVKMGSPRLGSLVGRVDPESQARAYARFGVAALSVVVEPEFFFGSFELLSRVKSAAGGALPVIAKDFVVCERQLDEAAAAGADAILLIAALYSESELRGWAAAARARGLAPLIETHDEADVARLAGADWELVGVNNRDLRTFDVDVERSISLAPSLPHGALKIAESGIARREQVDRLAAAGFDAFLVGESLLLADDPETKLAELFGAEPSR